MSIDTCRCKCFPQEDPYFTGNTDFAFVEKHGMELCVLSRDGYSMGTLKVGETLGKEISS